MTSLLFILAALFSVALILLVGFMSFGPRLMMWVLVLGTCALFPFLLAGGGSAEYHVGIAGPVPEVRTYTVVFASIAVVGFILVRNVWLPWQLVAFTASILLAASLVWPKSPVTVAGTQQLLVGVMAWYAGHLAANLSIRERSRLAAILFWIVSIQIVAAGVQLMGLRPDILTPIDAAILGDRVNGTTNHPNTLGKLLFAILLVCLFLFNRIEAYSRRLIKVTIAMIAILAILAQGRANTVALIAAIAVWAALLPRVQYRSLRRKVSVGIAFGTFFAIGAFWSRIEADPRGGVRSTIQQFALDQIEAAPLWGTGPNNYTTVVGPATGSWIPVHNSFLLIVAELGIPIALVFGWTMAAVLRRALGVRRGEGQRSAGARALLAGVPGLLVIGLTGWGLLGTSIFPLLMFIGGALSHGLGTKALLAQRSDLGIDSKFTEYRMA